MKQTIYRQAVAVMALAVLGLVVAGCNTDGPEFIGGDTRLIEGLLQMEETSDTHFFALTRAGTVNILATTIEGRLPDTGDPVVDPVLVVSIGAPNPEDATVCQLTFSKSLSVGDSFSIYYREGLFCTSVFRLPGTPETADYDYVFTMTGAFS